METYSFVHAADLHLDSPFKGIKRVAPDIAEILHQATFRAFNSIIDLCIQAGVDALLVAGDIFDSADNLFIWGKKTIFPNKRNYVRKNKA